MRINEMERSIEAGWVIDTFAGFSFEKYIINLWE